MLASPSAPSAQPTTGTVIGKIVLTGSDNKRVERVTRVFVYVSGLSDPPKTKRPEVLIEQIDQKYVPDLRVVPVGTTVRFPNRDNYEHNVFSPEEFDLLRYTKGPGKTKKL